MNFMKRLNRKFCVLTTKIQFGRKFKHIGKNSYIRKPIQIDNPAGIEMYDAVAIGFGSWIYMDSSSSRLIIRKNASIGNYSHIVVKEQILIDESVLIADKVFISDCSHIYEKIDIPIKNQGIEQLRPVHIGIGSWIGENVCIIGADVGKHCIIGANSVVLNSIPDYCVAAGCPAKVVKKYNQDIQKWVRVYET